MGIESDRLEVFGGRTHQEMGRILESDTLRHWFESETGLKADDYVPPLSVDAAEISRRTGIVVNIEDLLEG